MIKLIKAELKKIFHKKSFYVITVIYIAFCILTNIIYKNMDKMVYTDNNIDIKELQEINTNLDLNKKEDLEEYISNLTIMEINELKKSYDSNTQKYLIDNLYDLIYEKNVAKYDLKNKEQEETLTLNLNTQLTKIKNNEWEYFTKEKIEQYKTFIDSTNDSVLKEKYKEIIKLEEYRLNNNIAYDDANYLFVAIDAIETDLSEFYNLKNKSNLTKIEKERLTYLEEEMLINNYILEHKEDINNSSTLNAVLKNFANEFSIFILIYVIMICGSIMSEEFSKGTIKYLLTKPYKRSTILTSKLLTSLLLIPVLIIFMVIIELVIGGFVLGFNSISIPVVLYNANQSSLVTYNIFSYTSLYLLSILPIYIILGIACFSLSTITASTSAATTITFLIYLISNVIVTLVKAYNIKFLKYYISIHWDFSYLINFQDHPFNFNIITSILIIIIYIIVILCLTYIYFAKKDVKNI